MKTAFEQSQLARKALTIHIPRWDELPNIDLYMDQLVSVINGVYANVTDPSELPLTKSMVNNYVKARILPPPVNKRYQRVHLAMLMALYPLKKVFSLPECIELLRTLSASDALDRESYDLSCDIFEYTLRASFGRVPEECPPEFPMPMYRAAQVCTGKLYLQKYMQFVNEKK